MRTLSNFLPFRFLITWRNCQSFPGFGSVGGAPRPPYSGTFPHGSHIAFGYAPFPSLDIAGGPSSGACIFTCSISSGAISSSVFPMACPTRRRLSISMAFPIQKVPLASSSNLPPFHPYAIHKSIGHRTVHD